MTYRPTLAEKLRFERDEILKRIERLGSGMERAIYQPEGSPAYDTSEDEIDSLKRLADTLTEALAIVEKSNA